MKPDNPAKTIIKTIVYTVLVLSTIFTVIDVRESVDLLVNNFLDTSNGVKPKNSLDNIDNTMISAFVVYWPMLI